LFLVELKNYVHYFLELFFLHLVKLVVILSIFVYSLHYIFVHFHCVLHRHFSVFILQSLTCFVLFNNTLWLDLLLNMRVLTCNTRTHIRFHHSTSSQIQSLWYFSCELFDRQIMKSPMDIVKCSFIINHVIILDDIVLNFSRKHLELLRCHVHI